MESNTDTAAALEISFNKETSPYKIRTHESFELHELFSFTIQSELDVSEEDDDFTDAETP